MTKHCHSYLALGDSYTVGEGLPLYEGFPYQAAQLLRQKGYHIHAPEIVAKTGWTTFELAEHLLHMQLNNPYDFVTLLIGVNNQYRNLLANDYKNDFEFLVKKAIQYCGDKHHRVFVFSIPDWGRSPFAQNRDTIQIAEEIATFNTINQQLAIQYQVRYIDIASHEGSVTNELYSTDKLHPSHKEYSRWAHLLAEAIIGTV